MKQIPVTTPVFQEKEIEYITDCIKSSWVSSGKYIKLFEEKFAKFCGVSYSSTSSSGTSALHLVLLALQVKYGDEVIIPDLTYVSTANAIYYTGAKPIFVDVDKDTWVIDPNEFEKKINKNTKAIIVVHLYGHPADMDSINTIAKKNNIIVIEDVCQAHGATYKGKKVGSISRAGCFSFSGAKVITTGEGGMIVSNDSKLIKKINAIKYNFITKKRHFYHSDIGYPYRFTNIQAALGLAQLERIQKSLRKKTNNAKLYNAFFANEELIQLPAQKPWAKNVFWLYSIVLRKTGLRDKLMQYLKDSEIQTRPFFMPMHKLPMYKQKERFPTTEFLSENGISLPSGLTLIDGDIEFVCSKVIKFLKTHA